MWLRAMAAAMHRAAGKSHEPEREPERSGSGHPCTYPSPSLQQQRG
jgi:hypothetical protein